MARKKELAGVTADQTLPIDNLAFKEIRMPGLTLVRFKDSGELQKLFNAMFTSKSMRNEFIRMLHPDIADKFLNGLFDTIANKSLSPYELIDEVDTFLRGRRSSGYSFLQENLSATSSTSSWIKCLYMAPSILSKMQLPQSYVQDCQKFVGELTLWDRDFWTE